MRRCPRSTQCKSSGIQGSWMLVNFIAKISSQISKIRKFIKNKVDKDYKLQITIYVFSIVYRTLIFTTSILTFSISGVVVTPWTLTPMVRVRIRKGRFGLLFAFIILSLFISVCCNMTLIASKYQRRTLVQFVVSSYMCEISVIVFRISSRESRRYHLLVRDPAAHHKLNAEKS
eukprot:sb/3472050/